MKYYYICYFVHTPEMRDRKSSLSFLYPDKHFAYYMYQYT